MRFELFLWFADVGGTTIVGNDLLVAFAVMVK